jgi:hypothetical protein
MPHFEMPLPNIPEENLKQNEHPLKPIPYEIDLETGSALSDDVYEAFEKNRAEILGEGEECLVVALPDHPDKAIAYSFHNSYEDFDAKRAKVTFYAHKIMKILFPHNFPNIYATIAEDKNKNKGTIRERIHHGPYGRMPIKNSFRDVAGFCTNVLRVPASLYFDTNEDNFVLGDDGGEYYLDLITTTDLGSGAVADVFSSKEAKIIEYMDSQGFSKDDIDKVSRYIGRMNSLNTETRNQTQDQAQVRDLTSQV